MSQTNSKVRDIALENAGDHVETGIQIGWISWTWRHDNAIGLVALDFRQPAAKRHHRNPGSPLDKRSDDIAFHAAVKHHDMGPDAVEHFSSIGCNLPDGVILS